MLLLNILDSVCRAVYHLKVLRYSVHCIQEAKMNTDTHIFKINMNLHLDPKRPLS